MDFDDRQELKKERTEWAQTLLNQMRGSLQFDGDYHQVSAFLAREQTALLMTLVAQLGPSVEVLEAQLNETNARLENIERMIHDLWSVHY